MVVLAACGPAFVAVQPSQVHSIAVVPPERTATFCANTESIALRALVTYQDGTRLSNVDLPGEKLDARIRSGELIWTASLGQIDAAALLHLPADRLTWLDQPLTIQVASARDPKLAQSIALTPRYDCGLVVADGHHGRDGARDVEVAMTYVELPRGRMALIRVGQGAAPAFYLMDDQAVAGSFAIYARGGAGGDGADGAPGDRGADGSTGRAGADGRIGPHCSAGDPGQRGGDGQSGGNGQDGDDGRDGSDGGSITIRYDERYPELARLLRTDVTGGAGGHGGEGGAGGAGGSGGRGGDGGRGGRSTDPTQPCEAQSGNNAISGNTGPDGLPGVSGRPGRPGRDGEVHAQPASVDALFGNDPHLAVPAPADAPPAS